MNDQVELKKAIFGIGAGVLLFYIGWRIFGDKPEKKTSQPPVTKENIDIALAAYQDAVQAGEPQSKLNEINDQLAKDFGLRVKQRPSDGRFVVSNLAGKQVHIA